jgi:hypothetical protein
MKNLPLSNPPEAGVQTEDGHRRQRLSTKALHELHLHEGTTEPNTWRALFAWASLNQDVADSLRPATRGVDGLYLQHEVLLPNAEAAAKFLATVALQELALELRRVEQLAETLPDHRVTLVGYCDRSALELTKRSSSLILGARALLGGYEGYVEVPAPLVDEPGVIRTNLMHCFARDLKAPVKPPRRLNAIAECIEDAVKMRSVLAPWVLSWTDATAQAGASAETHAGTGRDIDLVIAQDAPCVDHLVWLLGTVPDLHVAAETLRSAARYTGRRLPPGLIERMTPPLDVRQVMADRLSALCDALEDMACDAKAARDTVIRTLPGNRAATGRSGNGLKTLF